MQAHLSIYIYMYTYTLCHVHAHNFPLLSIYMCFVSLSFALPLSLYIYTYTHVFACASVYEPRVWTSRSNSNNCSGSADIAHDALVLVVASGTQSHALGTRKAARATDNLASKPSGHRSSIRALTGTHPCIHVYMYICTIGIASLQNLCPSVVNTDVSSHGHTGSRN